MIIDYSAQATMSLDALRRNFRPDRIRLLVVAESPPPRIGFFYDARSREGALSRTTRQALEQALRTSFTRLEFLDAFQRNHCFLYDLLSERGKTVRAASAAEKEVAVRNLGTFLRREKPEYVVSALRRIDHLVRDELPRTELRVDYTNLPFPSRQWVKLYRDGMRRVLRRLVESPQPYSR